MAWLITGSWLSVAGTPFCTPLFCPDFLLRFRLGIITPLWAPVHPMFSSVAMVILFRFEICLKVMSCNLKLICQMPGKVGVLADFGKLCIQVQMKVLILVESL